MVCFHQISFFYNDDPIKFISVISICWELLYSMLLTCTIVYLQNIKQVNFDGTGISHCIMSFAAVERKAVYYSLFNQTKETYTTRDHWSLIYGQG